MKARDVEFVVVDVETTGLSALEGDRIIEIAAARVRGLTIVDHFESFVNPLRDIPASAQQVHHITPEMVMSEPPAREVLPRFVDFIGGACLCGQNPKFDLDFICHELSLAGRQLGEGTPVVDTIKMAKYFLPQLASYRLHNVAKALGVKVGVTHRAMADVELTAAILCRLLTVAEGQGLGMFVDVLREFGVQKPRFRLPQEQNLLF